MDLSSQNGSVVFKKAAAHSLTTVDAGRHFGTLFTDLWKTSQCLSHEVLHRKLHVHGFSLATLNMVHSYVTNRIQRAKVIPITAHERRPRLGSTTFVFE